MIDRCGTDDEAPGRKPFPGNLDAFEAARSTSLVAIGITGCVWVGKYKMLCRPLPWRMGCDEVLVCGAMTGKRRRVVHRGSGGVEGRQG